jgi:hypothetical protein
MVPEKLVLEDSADERRPAEWKPSSTQLR